MRRQETPGAALVTGGLGLIGGQVVELLASQGRPVVVLDDHSSARPGTRRTLPGVRVVRGDVRRAGDLDGLDLEAVDVVFHLAAQANVPASVADPRGDFETNAVGTLNVLEWARRREAARFVYASTVAVYQEGAPMPLGEDAPLRPSSPYGASKLAGEALVGAYHRTYGLSTAVVRLFNVYGEGMTKYVIHDLVRKLQANPRRLEILGTGEQVRDYIHASDAAEAFATAAFQAGPGAVLNVGSGVPVRIRDLADRIIAAMGLSGVETRFTGSSWAGDIDAWYADIGRMQALGWSPGVSLEEGLRRTVAWLQAHPKEAR